MKLCNLQTQLNRSCCKPGRTQPSCNACPGRTQPSCNACIGFASEMLQTNWFVISRWDKYGPCGRRIDGAPFVAFKVPLAEVKLQQFFASCSLTRYLILVTSRDIII